MQESLLAHKRPVSAVTRCLPVSWFLYVNKLAVHSHHCPREDANPEDIWSLMHIDSATSFVKQIVVRGMFGVLKTCHLKRFLFFGDLGLLANSERFLRIAPLSPDTYSQYLWFLVCRRPQSISGPGGGGAGGHWSADGGLAGYSDAIPGSPSQLGYHLFPPCLRHPPQTVGAGHRRRRPAEDALLKKGTPKRLPKHSHQITIHLNKNLFSMGDKIMNNEFQNKINDRFFFSDMVTVIVGLKRLFE